MNIFVTYSNTPNCIEFGDKPDEKFLAQPEKFIPILGGKSLYNGKNEFLKNIKGDNTGNNVSILNPYINQHSVIYWAGKNLSEINADYIGFCHYRRLFDVPDDDTIDENTIYVNKMNLSISNSLYFLINHDPNINRIFAEFVQKYIRSNNKNITYEFIHFLQSDLLFSGNMFIMHKNNFKKYIELITPIYNILFSMIYPFPNVSDRSFGFILERITTYIILLMKKNDSNIKIKQGKYLKLDNLIT